MIPLHQTAGCALRAAWAHGGPRGPALTQLVKAARRSDPIGHYWSKRPSWSERHTRSTASWLRGATDRLRRAGPLVVRRRRPPRRATIRVALSESTIRPWSAVTPLGPVIMSLGHAPRPLDNANDHLPEPTSESRRLGRASCAPPRPLALGSPPAVRGSACACVDMRPGICVRVRACGCACVCAAARLSACM